MEIVKEKNSKGVNLSKEMDKMKHITDNTKNRADKRKNKIRRNKYEYRNE